MPKKSPPKKIFLNNNRHYNAAKKECREMSAKKSKKKPKSMASLESKANRLVAELNAARMQISQNEASLAKKITQKTQTENELNRLLMRNLSHERAILSAVKRGSAKKQENLKKKIASLQVIDKVYNEKRSRIAEARKRQAALKKQLRLLERKVAA